MSSTTYANLLRESADTTDSILSVGYDPVPAEFPLSNVSGYDPHLPNPMGEYDGEAVTEYIVAYFDDVLEECKRRDLRVGSFKFNLGYFRMYDSLDQFPGLKALARVLRIADAFDDVPIILDVKDADIARTSVAYATSKLKSDLVDAVTVPPYMGTDSVEPFFEFADDRGQGVYVLTRTTNPGAADFQDLSFRDPDRRVDDSSKLYQLVAEKIVKWSQSYPGTVGSVAAGNTAEELRKLAETFAGSDASIPLLIPGVGTQGGTAEDVMGVLQDAGYDYRLARINSSSGIMYRAQKDSSDVPHEVASADEMARLNTVIRSGR